MTVHDNLTEKATAESEKWEQYAVRNHIYDSIVPPTLTQAFKDYNNEVKNFVDVGCGDGALLQGLKMHGWFSNRTIYGIDLSQTRLDRLKQICPEVSTILASAESIKLPDECIDFAISTQVIEHVLDQPLMLDELARIVRPGGKLYLTTVFKRWYGWYFYRCNGRWVMDPTHLREYQDDGELIPDMQKAGFKIIKNIKTPISYPLIDPFLRRFNIHHGESGVIAILRKIKVPIPGYYNWEIFAEKI